MARLTPQAFAEKWSKAALSERASYQQHFLDRCAMLNQPLRETENVVGRQKGWANASAYCASKFGLAGFSQALADEGRLHGVRAVMLYAGAMAAGAMATSWGAWSPEERREMKREDASPGQVLPPEEVAAFIMWLATSPPEFVLTEGIMTPIEEGLP